MKTLFIHYQDEPTVKVEFRPTYILITSKSKRAKKCAIKLIRQEAAKSNISLKKRNGRYCPRDLSNYIENCKTLHANLLKYWWIKETE